MKRWAICRMVQVDGALEAAVNRYRCNTRIWSKPGFAWCLAQIAAPDLTAINADGDIFVLPDATLDAAWSSFPAGTRNNVKNKLEAAGFTFSAVQNSWTVRQILVYLVQQIEPGISSVENGDVIDIEQ